MGIFPLVESLENVDVPVKLKYPLQTDFRERSHRLNRNRDVRTPQQNSGLQHEAQVHNPNWILKTMASVALPRCATVDDIHPVTTQENTILQTNPVQSKTPTSKRVFFYRFRSSGRLVNHTSNPKDQNSLVKVLNRPISTKNILRSVRPSQQQEREEQKPHTPPATTRRRKPSSPASSVRTTTPSSSPSRVDLLQPQKTRPRSKTSPNLSPKNSDLRQGKPLTPRKPPTPRRRPRTPPSSSRTPSSTNRLFDGWTRMDRPELRLDALEVIGQLGEGHYGSVKLVRTKKTSSPKNQQPSLERRETFALKVIERNRFETKHEEKYVFAERDILFEIDHPFHVKLYNTFKSATRIFMLMEAHTGDDLCSVIERSCGVPDVSTACFYTANLIVALKYLHKRGITHRDIKPANVLVGDDGYLRICDFGFARKLGIGERTRSIAGTYAYLHPAQCRDDYYDHSVDLWALGISVYEMIYGCNPFEAEHDGDYKKNTMYNIQYKDLRFPETRRVPLAAKLFIRGLLSRKEDSRLGSDLKYDRIFQHAWFSDIDWQEVGERRALPPRPRASTL